MGVLRVEFELVLLFLTILNVCWANDDPCEIVDPRPTCYSKLPKGKIYRFYGTPTTLTESRQHGPNRLTDDSEQCQPVMFYMVSRHSIRYPEEKHVRKINKVLLKLQSKIVRGSSSLCSEDLSDLLAWKPRMTPSEGDLVPRAGYEETGHLGCEYFKKYPDLLNPDKTNIEVGITNLTRTKQTADAFIAGITNRTVCPNIPNEKSWKPQKVEQPFLSFHTICEEIYKEHGGQKKHSQQVIDFMISDAIKELGTDVKNRLGLRKRVHAKTLKVLGEACAYEYAIYKRSPWCAAFGEKNMKVLEYYRDLKSYLYDGWGNPLYKSSCLLIQNLVGKVIQAVKEKGQQFRSYLYFTHSGALEKLWPELGLFEYPDFEVYRSPEEGYCSRQNRTWRTSWQVPFGSNLLVVLNKCSNDALKLATYVNGFPVKIKGCKSSMCEVDSFLGAFSGIAKNCDLQKICVPP